jgi:hypothetical protein
MKFRLLKASEFEAYSDKLKKFEKQFVYPLGRQQFHIRHGGVNGDYFTFFQSLGQQNIFVLEHKGRLLGAGCAILRNVKQVEMQTFWYLCDFKLNKSVRGKKLLTYLLIRYLIPFCCQSKNIVVINMSAPKNNWLVKKINAMLFFLKLKIKPMYFYEWTYDEYLKAIRLAPALFTDIALYTNYGNKDIIIDHKVRPIIHIVNKDHASINLPRHKIVKPSTPFFKETTKQTIFMLASCHKLEACADNQHQISPSYIGTMICSKAINERSLRFSSVEI